MRSVVVAFALLGTVMFTVAQAQDPARVRADAPVRPGALPVRSIQGDMVLEIDGVPQRIEVQSWSWGVTQTGAARAGGGGGAGRAQFEAFTVTKQVDATSPQLLVDTASGRHFPQAVLTVRTSGGGYVRYTLGDVLISGLTVDASSGAPTESLSFNFGRIEIEVGGAGQAAPVSAGWDVARNSRM
jgi:type VI secretion system secreted protein Hcp